MWTLLMMFQVSPISQDVKQVRDFWTEESCEVAAEKIKEKFKFESLCIEMDDPEAPEQTNYQEMKFRF